MSRDAAGFKRVLFLGLLAGWVSAGCAPSHHDHPCRDEAVHGPLPPRLPAAESTALPEPPEWPREAVLGRSVEGRPIRSLTYGEGDQICLIIAGIHGNEAAGIPLVARLGEYLLAHQSLLIDRTVVIVPVANPDGVAARRRGNSRSVDLNRNFPAGNYVLAGRHGSGPLSEPESRLLHDLILKLRPHRITVIHQPLSCIDYDGPARTLAEAMAERSDLPVKRLGSLPGSLGSFAGVTRKTPIVTIEFPRAADQLNSEALWQRYGGLLTTFVCHPEDPPTP